MDKLLKIAVMLTAVDKMSSVIKNAVGQSTTELQKLSDKQKKLFSSGAAMLGTGAAVTASLAPAVTAYADLEEAQLKLKASMMGPGGVVSELFPKVNKLAEQLGDQLPGTTADFYNMFEVMQNSGIKTESILNGVGKAASYLAVNIKMPYDEAGKFAAKMKESTGVADADMLKFMDTIARVKNVGVEAGEMQYAFAKSGGTLKMLGLQGLEASKSVSNVYAQLIRAGNSGETVGTGFASVIGSMLDPKKMAKTNEEAAKLGLNFNFFKDGKFVGIENMIAQLSQLSKFDVNKKASVLQALTGGGQDFNMLNTLIANGVQGFNNMNNELAKQATLEQKVGSQLTGLKALWEATTGTITNLLAAIGEGLAPALKPVVVMMGQLAGWVKSFLQENPRIAEFLSMMVAATGVFLTMVGVVKMVQGAFIALRIVMLANPFMLIAAVAIVAISFIYANWGKISGWFVQLWQKVKQIAIDAWEGIKSSLASAWQWMKDNWGKLLLGLIFPVAGVGMLIVAAIKKWFPDLYNAGAEVINGLWEGMKNKFNEMIANVKDMGKQISGAFKDVLGIKSPSRVFMQHGMHITQGAFMGMEKGKSLVQRGAQALGNAMVPQPSMQAIAVRSGGGSRGGGGVTVQMNINVAGGATASAANSFVSELRKNKGEIARIIQEAFAQRERRSF